MLSVGLGELALLLPKTEGKLRHWRAEVGSCVSDTLNRPPGILFPTLFGYAHVYTYMYILQCPEIYEGSHYPESS